MNGSSLQATNTQSFPDFLFRLLEAMTNGNTVIAIMMRRKKPKPEKSDIF